MCSVKMEEKKEKVSFEDALTLTGFGRANALMMVVISCIIVAMAFEMMSVGYLVPASACELHTSSDLQGLMAGMPIFGILAASNIWGYLADTRGRRKILIVSLILGFLAGSSATLSPNWITFCVLKFMSSFSIAGCFGLSMAYLSECTPERKRFTLILCTTSVFMVASGTMAALTIPILPLQFSYPVPYLGIQFTSWRLLNVVFSCPCALAAFSLCFALESPKYLLSRGKEKDALKVLRRFFVMNTGLSAENYKVEYLTLDEDSVPVTSGFWSSLVSQTTPLFKPPLLQRTLLLSVLFICVYFCLNPFQVWLPFMVDGFMRSLERGERGLTFCQMMRASQNDTTSHDLVQADDCTLNQSAMTLVLGLNLILATANTVLSTLLPIVGRKTLLIGLQLVAGVCGLSIAVCSVWQVTAALLVLYLGGVLNFGFLSTFSVDVFPTYVKAMGVCLTLMIGRGSAVAGVNILKSLLARDCETAFYLYGSITLFGGFVGFLLPSEKKTEAKPPHSDIPHI